MPAKKKNGSPAPAPLGTTDGLPPIPETFNRKLDALAKRNQERLRSGNLPKRPLGVMDLFGALGKANAEEQHRMIEVFEEIS